MVILSKENKLLTLALLLHSMSQAEKSLLMSHFSPGVVESLNQIEKEIGASTQGIDWTPLYSSCNELQRILNECRQEISAQDINRFAMGQRPKLREYILTKLGKQKKGAPVFLSQEIKRVVDHFLTNLQKE